MNKITQISKTCKKIVKHPELLASVLHGEFSRKSHVISKYGFEKGLPTIDILDLLPGFQETVDPYSFLEGTSLVMDLALLKSLARKFKNCSYLEIGTWRGESVANVAKVAKKCLTILVPKNCTTALEGK